MYKKDRDLCKKLNFDYEQYKKIIFIQGIWHVKLLKKAFFKAIRLNQEI